MLNGSTNEERIWNYLKGAGLNDCGAAGLMGNLYAESGLRPNNLQNTYEKSLGYTDETYTAAVDSGAYANFAKDAAGYGLAQWTFWTRKQNLLAYAKADGKSVGDLETQLGFLMKELKESYGGVLTVLKSAGSVRQASDKVLLEFERPANQGTAVQEKRAGFGQKYYDTYAKAEEQEETSMGFKPRLTRPEAGNKYYITKSAGGYSDAIKGSPTDAACNVLHNCVGYAYGRFNEIVGAGSCKYLRPVNAENFMQYTNGLQVGQTPKLGACMVWRKGATLSGSDGAGHVAIVEQIISATEVVTSESGYGAAKPFWTQNRKKGTGNWGQGSGYVFLGFIYNPAVDDSESGTTQGTTGQTGSTTGKLTYKVGDTVNFTGTTHYTNSNAATGVKCKPGPAKVTAVAPSGKHPYHLVKAGGSCTVYGWVDAADIAGADGGTSGSDTLAVGDQVKMDKAATVYGTTGKFASWVYNSTLYVRSISGSRVVVSTQKTGAVTGAVDKKYLTKA
jgi:surface antigen